MYAHLSACPLSVGFLSHCCYLEWQLDSGYRVSAQDLSCQYLLVGVSTFRISLLCVLLTDATFKTRNLVANVQLSNFGRVLEVYQRSCGSSLSFPAYHSRLDDMNRAIEVNIGGRYKDDAFLLKGVMTMNITPETQLLGEGVIGLGCSQLYVNVFKFVIKISGPFASTNETS